jgi:glycosyltransferase involved in cell wall biosynthesis
MPIVEPNHVTSMPPKISIVTPSFNQAEFLDDTIRSVLDQNYPNLEYVVMDGGSTDGSVDIIHRHADQLTSWVSEKDGGQYAALNKGFSKTSGDVMAWINADDKYLPWTFSIVGEIFAEHPEIEWITSLFPLYWDKAGRAVSCTALGGFNRAAFFRGEHLDAGSGHSIGWIQQESTFWRRSLWERAGARIDTAFGLAADFELWARFYQHAELYGVGTPLGGFRAHGNQRSTHHASVYAQEAQAILNKYGGRPYGKFEAFLYMKLLRYLAAPIRRLAARQQLFYPRLLCLHRGASGGWRVRKTKFH